MSFPPKLLNPGEEVAADLRPHWKFLTAPAFAVVAVAAGSVSALVEGVPRFADLALAAVLVLCLLWLAGRWLLWASSSFVVTTQRLVMRKGVLRRTGREILLDRLTDISSSQSLLDRLLRCGDILVESPGRESPEVWRDLPRPVAVQNLICHLVVQSRANGFTSGEALVPAQPDDIAGQLARLGELRRSGVISRREFASKKADLLSRM
jgi:membrane protein YdbS with pleckstrin-like domain